MTHQMPQVDAVFGVFTVVAAVPTFRGVDGFKHQSSEAIVYEYVVVLNFAVFGYHHAKEIVGLVAVGGEGGRCEYAAIREGIQSRVGLRPNSGCAENTQDNEEDDLFHQYKHNE